MTPSDENESFWLFYSLFVSVFTGFLSFMTKISQHKLI